MTNDLYTLNFKEISPNEAYSLACMYSGKDVVVNLVDNLNMFCCNPKTKEINIPNSVLEVESFESYVQGIRHEAYHLKHTEYEIEKNNLLLDMIKQSLEDVRIDVKAESDFLGGRRLNKITYNQEQFLIPNTETNPKIETYIYALKRRGIFPSELLPFDLDPRLEDITKKCRKFPTSSDMPKLIEEAAKIIKEIYGKQAEEMAKKEAMKIRGMLKEGEGYESISKSFNELPDAIKEAIKKDIKTNAPKILEGIIKKGHKQYLLSEKERDLLGNNFIKIKHTDKYFSDEDKERLLDLIKNFSMVKDKEEGIEINRDTTELGIGLADSDLSLVFAIDDVPEEIRDGKVVICLDVSGSMEDDVELKNISNSTLRKINVATSLVAEFSELETPNCKIECYAFGSRFELWKAEEESITAEELLRRFNKTPLRGSTHPKHLIEHLANMNPPEDNVIYLFITDGVWSIDSYPVYTEKIVEEKRKAAVLFIAHSYEKNYIHNFPSDISVHFIPLDVEGKRGMNKCFIDQLEKLEAQD